VSENVQEVKFCTSGSDFNTYGSTDHGLQSCKPNRNKSLNKYWW